ncbi:DUF2807 domain-containing protein [Amphiplicatus metriothermophilus]|uniref:Uncharacterized protein n=1 Tax=Amphiplicatus metriothermophilus TaxID=1519374 RepID=A0A239PPW1_9PROT|nr:DUF2807 domain-containing protein [Amphiplicatus metriothermophilus]MBB5518524.1 hypothetical protein [Amphiplicatus metriothermophilus]SNT72315.1 hypothetical protein SAMN06297382_1355 [Amphiplicatus metriothermophilus]
MLRKTAFAAMLAAAVIQASAAAARFEAQSIRFENVVGTVEIVTNNGSQTDVVIRQGKTHAPLQLMLEDGTVRVVGEKWREEETRDCCNARILRRVDPRRGRTASTGAPVNEAFFADHPTIQVTMPRKGDAAFVDARVRLRMDALDGALDLDGCYVYGETGNLGEAVISLVEGSRLVIGDVAGALEADISGDADLRAGKAAMADIDIAGPGDVVFGEIGGMLDVSIAGSGTVRGARLDGPLTARIAGSGAVMIQAGRADTLKATIDGSGLVQFEGTAVRPDLRLFGSAEARFGAVEGRLSRAGGGEIHVGGVEVPR